MVDYALLDRSKPLIFVEAKCPSGDFMSRMNRLSGAPS